MKSSMRILSLSVVLGVVTYGGCGGSGDPVDPDANNGNQTIPLDGRGGGVLAYTYQPGGGTGHHEIHVMNADGTGDRRLITASIGLNHHDWSPDGQRLAAVGYYGETWSVHTFTADGQNLTRLTNTSGVWDNEPTWSPDGTRIVFSRSYPDQDFRSEIWMMDADGGDLRAIGVEGFQPRWSPDGTRLIYQSTLSEHAGGQADIMTCAVDGSDVRAVTDTPENELVPIWSPDGSLIAFSADYDGDFDLYVMNADGTDVRRLTDNSAGDYAPRWSPDGTRIAFDSDATGSQHWEVYIVGVDGTSLRRVTNTQPPNTAINPVWRPTG